jgi:hypothetical protein
VTTAATEELEAALAQLRAAVGTEHVLASEQERQAHAKDTSHWHRLPAAVVYPGTTEEVAEVVRIAARFKLQLWPSAKGKTGATAPTWASSRAPSSSCSTG